MNTMNYIVWMMPILYMLHDFEEITMAEVWAVKYKALIDKTWPHRQPFGINFIRYYQTPTFSFAVYLLFFISVLVSLLSGIFNNYFIWYSIFLAVTLHLFFIHILICIPFKHYIPGVISSAVLLLPAVWFVYQAALLLHYSLWTNVLAGLLGIALLALSLPILHKQMGHWSELLYRYSNKS